MSHQKAMINGTETRVLQSKNTQMKYRISIGLPHLYPDAPEKKWPIVYLIDSNLYFGMVTDIVRSMSWCGMTTDAIVVGIGYTTDAPLEEAWHDVMAWRHQDLTPVQDEELEKRMQEELNRDVKTGGADLFLKFMEEELMTMVENDYRVNEKEMALAGHSFGGLFTLYAMFQKPEIFRNYIACSPSVFYKDQCIFEFEEQYARRRKTLPASLFMSMGELEETPEFPNLSSMYRLSSQLESRKFKRFTLEKRFFPDEDHCTVIAPSLQAGLKLALRS